MEGDFCTGDDGPSRVGLEDVSVDSRMAWRDRQPSRKVFRSRESCVRVVRVHQS